MPLSHRIWRRDFPGFPGMPEYMEIFPECDRIVVISPLQKDHTRYVAIVMAYEEPEPGSVRTRVRPEFDWSECTYRMEGETINWTWSGKEWPWEPISDEELPGWFRGFDTRARQRFDEREAAAAVRKVDGVP